jgi:hypothetical protein
MSIIIISLVDPDDDDFTTASPHRLIDGDSIRMSATTAPDGTVNGTTYFARVISATKFAIHATRSDAKNNVNQIAISSQGADVTFLVGDSQFVSTKRTLTVNHPGSEPIPSVFIDYSRELVFVENVDTDYSEVVVPNGKKTDQVFMQGLTTSPTYIFTSGAPKAAPGDPEINEVWILS